MVIADVCLIAFGFLVGYAVGYYRGGTTASKMINSALRRAVEERESHGG